MRIRASVALAVALAAGIAGWPRSADAQPEKGPLVSGASAYVDGTFVWTDYAYDDRGANTDPLGEPGGDTIYPDGAENTADLIQLQIDRSGDGIELLAILQTLRAEDDPLVGVAFDTDRDPTTGAGSLPGGAWSPREPLGVEMLAVVSASGAELYAHSGEAWQSAGALVSSVDLAANVLRAAIPVDPGEATWRAFAVVGRGADSWLAGGPVFDLGFVREERPMRWHTIRQADVLAGRLESSHAAAEVDFGRIGAGETELPVETSPGFHSFLYHSSLDAEGIRVINPAGRATATQNGPIECLGPYQPYLVWVPDELPSPTPMLLWLTGGPQNYLGDTHFRSWCAGPTGGPGYAGTSHLQPAGDDPDDVNIHLLPLFLSDVRGPNFIPFTPPGIVVFPHGRGVPWVGGVGEKDAVDVLADAGRRFPLDADRVILAGDSRGGTGTWGLGVRHPDRFAVGVARITTTEPPAVLENLANLPIRAVTGLLDPFSRSATWALDFTMRLDALGYDHRHYLLFLRAHQSPPAVVSCLVRNAFAFRRNENPARVVYSVMPSMFVSDPETGLELRYDSAYWVSGLTVREAARVGTIDVTSLARADRARTAAPIDELHENATEGRDVCGPNPESRTGDVWHEHGIALGPGLEEATSNGLVASLRALESAALDLSRMSLRVDAPLTLDVTGDGGAELRLAGPWAGAVSVTRDGAPFGSFSPSDGEVTLTADFSGRHVWVLAPL